ncbi:MAG: ABC transporter permease, partial [Alkalibacterium sp.]|nr:ABC transporter permease [Alkalibacterium sp.]
MWKTIIRRVLLMIPQILILSILIFILADFMPGDPFTGLVDPNLDPAQLDAMREAYGLNDPLPVKYVRWMKNALQGDFGRSFNYQQPVTAVIAGRMGNTIRLSLLSIILTYLIGLPLGILAGRYNESILDKTVLVYNFVSFAVPIFVLALLM